MVLKKKQAAKTIQTNFFKAIREKNLLVLRTIQGIGARTITAYEKEHLCPLIEAVRTENHEIVQRVLEMGAHIEAVDLNKNTPLMLAAQLQQNEILILLLKHHIRCRCQDAKPSPDSDENTSSICAIINMQNEDGNTALTLASDLDTITTLINNNADINIKNNADNNALMIFASKGYYHAVSYLLKHKNADITTQNKDGDTALTLSIKAACQKTVQVLLKYIPQNTEHLADMKYLAYREDGITDPDSQGNNPLMIYASQCAYRSVNFLIKLRLFDINTFNHNGNTALFLAIQAGSLETVQALFTELPHSNTPNLNHQNKAGYTALMLTLLYNTDHKILRYLIDEQHADITFSNHAGNNALMIFASQGNSQIVQFLLDLKCFDLEHQNDDGDTALLLAAKAGSLQTIQTLCTKLPEYKPNIDHQNNAGYTALMLINDLEICRYLIEKQNADTTLTDKQGNNVLMLLASRGQSDAVEYLLTLQSFDINMKNLQGDTALNLALRSNSQKTATHLLPQTAMSPEHREIIENLAKRREGITTQDSQGKNPLIVFASQGNANAVSLLLSLRIFDINTANRLGNTALFFAIKSGSLETVQALFTELPHSDTPNLNHQNKAGYTALMLALLYNTDHKILRYLIDEQHADITFSNHAGNNALMIFASQGNSQIVQFLLDLKCFDLEHQNDDGDTALLLAAKAGSLQTIQTLCTKLPEYKPNIDHQNNAGYTALMLALLYNTDHNIPNYLLDTQKADINFSNRQGNNVLMIMASHGKSDALDYLLNLKCFNIDIKETSFLLALKSGWQNTAQILLPHTEKYNEHLEVIEALIHRSEGIRAQDSQGNNPLIVFASQGNANAVSLLLSLRLFDINTANRLGNTALFLAIQAGSLETVQALFTEPPHSDTPNLNHQNKAGYTALMLALLYNTDHKILRYLIDEQHADITFSNHAGNNALMIFASQGNSQIVQFLLDLKCFDLEHQNDDGDTALLLAAKAGSLQTIQTLCTKLPEYKPNIDHQNNAGYTALMLINDLEICRYLIEKQNADTTLTDTQGNNVLMLLARRGNYPIVQFLLSLKKFDIEDENNDGDTPLCLAIKSQDTQTVLALLKASNTQKKTSFLERPQASRAICYAIEHELLEIIQHLIEADKRILNYHEPYLSDTAMLHATRVGSPTVIRFLLEYKIEIALNARDLFLKTPIMIAASHGDLPVLTVLLDHPQTQKAGILNRNQIEKRDLSQNTALMLAAEGGHLQIAQFLAKTYTKLNVNLVNKYGQTALMIAARQGHLEFVKWLVADMKAETVNRDHNGYTALLLAAEFGSCDIVHFLVQNVKNIDINQYVLEGNTGKTRRRNTIKNNVLIYLAQFNCIELIKMLIDMPNLDLNYQNNEGLSALMTAVIFEHFDISELLVKKGALLDLKNQSGENALTLAISHKNTKMAHMFLDAIAQNPALLSLNDRNQNGDTPLITAARSGSDKSIGDRLVQLGACTHLMNKQAQTASDFLTHSHNLKIAPNDTHSTYHNTQVLLFRPPSIKVPTQDKSQNPNQKCGVKTELTEKTLYKI